MLYCYCLWKSFVKVSLLGTGFGICELLEITVCRVCWNEIGFSFHHKRDLIKVEQRLMVTRSYTFKVVMIVQ